MTQSFLYVIRTHPGVLHELDLEVVKFKEVINFFYQKYNLFYENQQGNDPTVVSTTCIQAFLLPVSA